MKPATGTFQNLRVGRSLTGLLVVTALTVPGQIRTWPDASALAGCSSRTDATMATG